ncbi:MAG: hypothetical protein IT236_17315 [Bacteroidia bacterium]|nr:hypothetical protein [Bacteroidia bacterium]
MKIKSLIVICSLTLSFICVRAQYNTNFINYSNTGRSVSANLDLEAGSNGMTSEMVDKLVFGGYIDNNLKARASKNMKGYNNFGINLNYDLQTFFKGNKKFDYLIGFKSQQIINATYSSDFYKLMFYGNQSYKGGTANLADCNVNALSFQEVKFGAVLNNIDSVGKIGISLSFIKGSQLFYIQTNKNSNLYTSADGSQLIFNSNFSMALSDPKATAFKNFNGVGASADIFFETAYKSKLGKKSVLIVNANNIGFIHWLGNSLQYNSDSTLRFSGYNINNITDLKDSTISRINGDSLLRDLSNARKESFNVNIPTNLVLINKIYFGDQRFCLGTGFRHIFNANYIPYVFIEPELKYKQMIFTLHTGYGGYSRLNLGLSVMWKTDDWFLRIGSNSLQGYVLPQTAYGQGLFFSIAKKLK